MKKKPEVYGADIPLVSREFAATLNRRFPELKPAPGISNEDLLYNAGMRKIVDWVIAVSSGTEILNDIIHTKDEPVHQSKLAKFINSVKLK